MGLFEMADGGQGLLDDLLRKQIAGNAFGGPPETRTAPQMLLDRIGGDMRRHMANLRSFEQQNAQVHASVQQGQQQPWQGLLGSGRKAWR